MPYYLPRSNFRKLIKFILKVMLISDFRFKYEIFSDTHIFWPNADTINQSIQPFYPRFEIFQATDST